MPGIVCLFDPAARPDTPVRFARMHATARLRPGYLMESWLDSHGRVGMGRADLGVFNHGPQPVESPDSRYRLCFQGEVFDRHQLKARLKAAGVPLSGSDSADLVLGTYQLEGLAGIAKLSGSYFFALWDDQLGTLTVGGDRYASRPHAYALDHGRLLIAPEVQGILAGLDAPPDASITGLGEVLGLEYPLGDHTLFDGVKIFPGGTFLTVSARGADWHTYWQPHYTGPDEARPRPRGQWLEQATHLYRQAVRRSLEGNVVVPISGGTDSRTILAFADRHDFPTFTFGEEDSEDVRYGRQVAAALGLAHHFLPLGPDFLHVHADEMMKLGEGMVSLFHSHDCEGLVEVPRLAPVMVFGMTAEYSRVHSIDEMLSVRPRNLVDRAGLIARHALSGHQPIMRFADERAFIDRARQALWNAVTPDIARRVLDPGFYAAIEAQVTRSIDEAVAAMPGNSYVDRLAGFNVMHRQRRFTQWGVKITNAVLEYRKPLEDYDLVDFLLTLPTATRRKLQSEVVCHVNAKAASVPRTGSGTAMNASLPRRGAAYLAKQVSRALRPERVQSFGNPQEALRGRSRSFYEALLLDPATLANGYFNPVGVATLVADHMAGRANAASTLCALATLELWRRKHQQELRLVRAA